MPAPDGDISLKEFVKTVKTAIQYLFKNWLIIILISMICGAIGIMMAYLKKPSYTGTASFVLSSDSKASSISGLASQFGFDLSSGGGNDVFTGDNILSLFKSQKMIKRALFRKVPANNEVLINLLVKENKWNEKWVEKERTKNIFPFPEDFEKMTPIQDSVFREMHKVIIDNNLSVSRLEKKLSVFILSTKSSNELLANYLTNFLLDETSRFFIITKTSSARQNLEMLQKEADSLQNLLGGTINRTVSTIDQTYNLNPAMLSQRTGVQKGQLSITVLTAAYGEVIKNLELAKIIIQRETPLYQVIDSPSMPLKKEKPSKLIYLIFGGGIGFLLISIILLIKRNIM